MSRLLRIAAREYLAYVRTAGFWLSMCLLPVILGVVGGVPVLIARTSPPLRLAVIDLTGRGYGDAIARAVAAPHAGPRGGARKPAAVIVPSPVPATGTAAQIGRALRPYLVPAGGHGAPAALDAAAIVHDQDGAPALDFWSRNVADESLQEMVGQAVADRMRAERLARAGLSPAQIADLDALSPKVASYSPRAATGQVGLRDRLPGIAGFAAGMLLWTMVMTGAGVLLNSVIEEKSSRILEVLLASASVPQVMGGKILGVAAVTLTVLTVWLGIAAAALLSFAPAIAGDLASVLIGKGLVLYFAVFLVGGYLMYASLFVAIGAFCETVREAQTLLAPVMMLLTIPIVFMSQAIAQPDSPAVAALAWFPLFTPFLAPVRAAAEPPLWQALGLALLVACAAAASLWLSARAFRAGALSSGRITTRAFFAQFFRPGRA